MFNSAATYRKFSAHSFRWLLLETPYATAILLYFSFYFCLDNYNFKSLRHYGYNR